MSFRSFLEIQQQQEEEAKQLEKLKTRRKSLLGIQIEENAIKELMDYYCRASVPYSGEYFEISTRMR